MREFFDDRRHRSACASLPGMLLEVVDLTNEVAGRTPGNPGDCIHSFEIRAMAGLARRRCAGSPRFGQSFALSDASFRNIRHELRTRVAMFELLYIHRDLDDTLTNGLRTAVLRNCVKHAGYLDRWNGIGFYNFDVCFWLER